VQLPDKCLHISTAFASHFAAPHHIDPARSVGFSTKQRRTPGWQPPGWIGLSARRPVMLFSVL
ncbi:hypothetical protein, partial [Escherichia coli]